MTLRIILGVAIFAGCAPAQDTITITTWNIEHLGTSGRGFGGGFGAGSLGKRSDADLKKIAALIRDDVKSDVLALQEISVSKVESGVSKSDELDTITAELGSDWAYYLPPVSAVPADADNMFCALMWNAASVNVLELFVMDVPNHDLAGGPLFDRKPVVGYFEVRKAGVGTNDFVLVNVHLKSGQYNEENHLIAITVIEHGLFKALQAEEIKETDRIILGDFNDNPYAKRASGNAKYSPALYQHMAFKKYTNLVLEDVGATRMDSNLKSIIDHILVSNSAKQHTGIEKATKYVPPGGNTALGPWRAIYSDHFPVSFTLDVRDKDDDVDFE